MKKLLVAFAILLTGCTSNAAAPTKPTINIYDTIHHIELGDKETMLSKENIFYPTRHTELLDSAVIDYAAVNRDVVGSYEAKVTFSDASMVRIIDIVVRDTVAPSLETKDITIIEGDSIDINSFVVSATDLQPVELSFKEEVDLGSVGTRSYTVVAKDASGNATEKTVNLTVEAKPVVNSWTPSNNGGGSSWTPPVNGGGGTTPAPGPAPSAPTVVGGYDCAGDYWTCDAKMEAWANAKYSQGWAGSLRAAAMSDGSWSEYYWIYEVDPSPANFR